jgi:hypothetical protein
MLVAEYVMLDARSWMLDEEGAECVARLLAEREF